MRKHLQKKLTLQRETVRHLSTELLKKAQAAAGQRTSDGCDTACTASTLSCTQ